MSDVDVLSMFTNIAKKVEPDKDFSNVTRESEFSSLGFDSVAMMEVIGEIEDELNISIPDDRLAQLKTVGDIEQAVLRHIEK